jgi:hypothetical protein
MPAGKRHCGENRNLSDRWRVKPAMTFYVCPALFPASLGMVFAILLKYKNQVMKGMIRNV